MGYLPHIRYHQSHATDYIWRIRYLLLCHISYIIHNVSYHTTYNACHILFILNQVPHVVIRHVEVVSYIIHNIPHMVCYRPPSTYQLPYFACRISCIHRIRRSTYDVSYLAATTVFSYKFISPSHAGHDASARPSCVRHQAVDPRHVGASADANSLSIL